MTGTPTMSSSPPARPTSRFGFSPPMSRISRPSLHQQSGAPGDLFYLVYRSFVLYLNLFKVPSISCLLNICHKYLMSRMPFGQLMAEFSNSPTGGGWIHRFHYEYISPVYLYIIYIYTKLAHRRRMDPQVPLWIYFFCIFVVCILYTYIHNLSTGGGWIHRFWRWMWVSHKNIQIPMWYSHNKFKS